MKDCRMEPADLFVSRTPHRHRQKPDEILNSQTANQVVVDPGFVKLGYGQFERNPSGVHINGSAKDRTDIRVG